MQILSRVSGLSVHVLASMLPDLARHCEHASHLSDADLVRASGPRDFRLAVRPEGRAAVHRLRRPMRRKT
jgi:hypothetical protein